jgi:hypothetical protein
MLWVDRAANNDPHLDPLPEKGARDLKMVRERDCDGGVNKFPRFGARGPNIIYASEAEDAVSLGSWGQS